MARLLTEVCQIQYGFPFDSAQFTTSDGIPLIRIRDVVRGYSETYTTEECDASYIVNDGDMLVGMDGEFNIARWKGGKAYLNQRVCRLIPKADICPEYLFHFMPGALKRIEDQTPFATVKHLSAKQLNAISVPLPSLEEQRHIANQLEAADSLISLRKQQIAKLDELVKARFVEMFGDETQFHKWECCCVGDVADVCVGVVIKPTQYYADQGIPAFRSLNIGELHVKDTDWVYFTEEGHAKNQKSVIRENDVLVVRSGAPGTACVATKHYAGYNAIDIIIAHPDGTKIDSVFLATFTNMPHGMNQIREKTGGAAQQHFNVGGYKALTLILPPLEMQHQFAAFVAQTDQQKSTIQHSLAQLELLKKALMQKYFG